MHYVKSKACSSLGVSVTLTKAPNGTRHNPYSSPTATQHLACGMETSRLSTGEDILLSFFYSTSSFWSGNTDRQGSSNMQGENARHSRAGILIMQGNHVLESDVQSSPGLLHAKVMTACKNVYTATAASCAPLMRSSRDRAKTPSSFSITQGERHLWLVEKKPPCIKLPCGADMQGDAATSLYELYATSSLHDGPLRSTL